MVINPHSLQWNIFTQSKITNESYYGATGTRGVEFIVEVVGLTGTQEKRRKTVSLKKTHFLIHLIDLGGHVPPVASSVPTPLFKPTCFSTWDEPWSSLTDLMYIYTSLLTEWVKFCQYWRAVKFLVSGIFTNISNLSKRRVFASDYCFLTPNEGSRADVVHMAERTLIQKKAVYLCQMNLEMLEKLLDCRYGPSK